MSNVPNQNKVHLGAPTRMEFVREARECIGTPYRHMGRMKGEGLDCIGLVYVVAKNVGCDTRAFVDEPYGNFPDRVKLRAQLSTLMEPIWDQEVHGKRAWRPLLRNGDIVLLAWKRYATHTGIVAISRHGWNVIHAFGKTRNITEHLMTPEWDSRVRGVYRIRQLTDV